MGKFPVIKQHVCESDCPWHGCHADGKEYSDNEILPRGICPFLYHSLYPYFLGLLYHADMQDIWVCCPAEKGVDVLIRREEPNHSFGHVPPHWWVIYAEVVNVGECPNGHVLGQKLLFPMNDKLNHLCPAGLNNVFPFLDLEVPKCINPKRLRCPDWRDTIYYEVK